MPFLAFSCMIRKRCDQPTWRAQEQAPHVFAEHVQSNKIFTARHGTIDPWCCMGVAPRLRHRTAMIGTIPCTVHCTQETTEANRGYLVLVHVQNTPTRWSLCPRNQLPLQLQFSIRPGQHALSPYPVPVSTLPTKSRGEERN